MFTFSIGGNKEACQMIFEYIVNRIVGILLLPIDVVGNIIFLTPQNIFVYIANVLSGAGIPALFG